MASSIHPSLVIGENVTIEEPVTIGSNVTLRDNVVIKQDAIIDSNIIVGNYTVVDTLCLIQDNVIVGSNCYLGFNSTIDPNISIGDGCWVGVSAELGTPLTVEDNVFVGDLSKVLPNAYLGSSTYIGARVQLGENVEVAMPTTKRKRRGNRYGRRQTADGYDTVINDGAIIGARTSIARGTQVGNNTLMGSNNRLQEGVSILSGLVGTNNTFGTGTQLGKNANVDSNVQLGPNNTMGDRATIVRGTVIGQDNAFGNDLRIDRNAAIGDSNVFGINTRVGHEAVIGSGGTYGNDVSIQANSVVGDDVTFGQNTTVYPFTNVATGTNITANSALGVDPTSPFEATSSSSLPIIIGVVVGVLLLVAVIGAGLCWYRRKSREHIELLKPMPEGFTPEIFSQVDDEGQIHLRDLYRQMNRDIPPEILYRQEVIGQGAFGKVYRGVLYENKTFSAVAIKEVQDATGDNAMELLDEANLMRRLHHSCIVSCIGICSETRKPGEPGYIEPESVGAKDDEHTHVAMTTGEEREVEVDPMLNVIRVSIVLEFLPCGDLKDYLDKNTINMTEKLWYVQQMARGMAYLEREGIVHRDLAARNCMLGTGGPASFGFPYLKVSDFGLSRQIRDDKSYYTMTHQGKVPARWLPPESYRLLKFSSKSDAWAFGVTTWEIFSNGKIPYENMNLALVLEQLENCVLRLSCPQGCPDDVFNDLMMNTWANAPDDRPDFQQLMNCATHKMKMYSDVFCEVVMVEEETGDITIMPVDEPNFDDAMGDNEITLQTGADIATGADKAKKDDNLGDCNTRQISSGQGNEEEKTQNSYSDESGVKEVQRDRRSSLSSNQGTDTPTRSLHGSDGMQIVEEQQPQDKVGVKGKRFQDDESSGSNTSSMARVVAAPRPESNRTGTVSRSDGGVESYDDMPVEVDNDRVGKCEASSN